MKPKKRLLSLLLCVTMLFSLCPQSVSAEGSMGTACTHEHTDDCYMEVIECVHEHDENCYSEIEGSISENDATPSNATQREPENCTHICTEESGCIIRTLNCLHEHDEDCTFSPETAAPAEGTEGGNAARPIEFTVTKATLAESDYTAPTANTGLTYMKDTDQALINTGSFGSNVTTTGSNAPKFWYGWKNDNDTISWVTSAVTGRDAGEYTVYWYIDGGTNYENVGSAENPAGTLTVTIAPMKLTIVSATFKSKTYDGTTKAEVDTIPFFRQSDMTTVALDSEDYKVPAAFTTKDAGSDKAVNCTVMLKNSNYTFVDPGTAQETDTQTFTVNGGTISKATLAEPLQGITVYRKAGSREPQTVAVTAAVVGMPADAGNVRYALSNGHSNNEFSYSIDGDTGIVMIFKVPGNAGDSKAFTVNFISINYADANVAVTVVLTDKKIPTLTMSGSPITKVYDGQPLPDSAITGMAADGETPVEGTWSWTGKAPQNVADSGNVSVTFTPTDSDVNDIQILYFFGV